MCFSFKSTEGKFRLEMRNDAGSFGTCVVGISEIRSGATWRMYHGFQLGFAF